MIKAVYRNITIFAFSCLALFALLFIFISDRDYQSSTNFLQKHLKPLYKFHNQVSNIKKPLNDKNNYEIFTLQNGIQTLLVSAPAVQYFGAVLTIKGVGSYQDGEYPGLSHFIEHLVFTGSKNYPNWDLASEIQINQGIFNGLTMSNTTQYPLGFSDETVLEETLKKIVDFIINPGLKEDVINKEIYAITSEYHLDLVDSENKVEYFWKMMANKNSDFHRFDIGSIKSLQKVLENPQILRDFIKRTYVPENMFLVIYTSNEMKEVSKQKVSKIFEQIPKQEKKQAKIKEIPPVFPEENKGILVKIKDTSKVNEMIISFNTKFYNSYQTQSVNYIQTMLQYADNDEDFCSRIQKNFLASDCNIFSENINRNEVMQGVQLTLTKRGQKMTYEIINSFMSYIEVIKQKGVSEDFYKAIQKMADFQFQYQEQQDMFNELTELGLLFSWNPNQNLFYSQFDYSQFNEKEINSILNQMTYENAIISLRSKEFNDYAFTNNKEIQNFIQGQQYNTSKLWDFDYSVYKFKQEDSYIFKNFSQPVLNQIKYNEFVQQMSLNIYMKMIKKNQKQEYDNSNNKPSLISSNEKGNLWHFEDVSFEIPYVAQFVLMDHEGGISNAKETLYLQLLSNYLNSMIQAEVFYPTPRGLGYSMYLPNQLIYFLGTKFLSSYRNLTIDVLDTQMDYILECYQISLYQNLETYTLVEAMDYVRKIIFPGISYTQEELQQELLQFDITDFVEWVGNYQQKTHLEVLIMGNIEQKGAQSLYQKVEKALDFQANDAPYPKTGTSYLNNVNYLIKNSTSYDHYNEFVVNVYMLPKTKHEQKLILSCFNLLFGGYAFQFLRSENQLGYIAEAEIENINNINYLIVLVGGYRENTEFLDQKIEELFTYVQQQIENVEEDEIDLTKFDTNQTNTKIEQYSEIYYSLSQEALTFWMEIISEDYFGIPEKMAFQNKTKFNETQPDIQKTIKKEELLDIYKEWFKDIKNKLSVQVQNNYKNDQPLPKLINTSNYGKQSAYQIFDDLDDLLKFGGFQECESQKYPLVNIYN